MKKLISTVMSIILLTGVLSINVSASEEVQGLHECLSRLLMKNYFTEEQFAEMEKNYMEFLSDDLLNNYIPLRQEVDRMETGSVEEEYELLMEQGKLNYTDGLRVSHFVNYNYGDQYAKAECFDYLFDEEEYWSVPLKRTGIANGFSKFKIDGERIENFENHFEFKNSEVLKQNAAFNLITEESTIKNLLLEKGEKKVEDIKFCPYAGGNTGLYIKCPQQEYFIKVFDYSPNYELYKNGYEFMTAEEMTQALEKVEHDRASGYVTPTKPLFEAEAESLQAEGLLKGNENGLDLLKPLTRIEAATMLLRAMGKDETADASQAQTFSDVPSEHWGFGAAENAYNLGLIKGVGDDKFAPDESVTAEQFATMVLRAGQEPEFNWEEAINIMIEKGIISQENASTMDFFTRGDMAKIIYEARANGLL